MSDHKEARRSSPSASSAPENRQPLPSPRHAAATPTLDACSAAAAAAAGIGKACVQQTGNGKSELAMVPLNAAYASWASIRPWAASQVTCTLSTTTRSSASSCSLVWLSSLAPEG